jgi:hypothetical protein
VKSREGHHRCDGYLDCPTVSDSSFEVYGDGRLDGQVRHTFNEVIISPTLKLSKTYLSSQDLDRLNWLAIDSQLVGSVYSRCLTPSNAGS